MLCVNATTFQQVISFQTQLVAHNVFDFVVLFVARRKPNEQSALALAASLALVTRLIVRFFLHQLIENYVKQIQTNNNVGAR
jgi:hypothetical protein